MHSHRYPSRLESVPRDSSEVGGWWAPDAQRGIQETKHNETPPSRKPRDPSASRELPHSWRWSPRALAWNRDALSRGFSNIGVPFDAVYLWCGSTDVRAAGLSRERSRSVPSTSARLSPRFTSICGWRTSVLSLVAIGSHNVARARHGVVSGALSYRGSRFHDARRSRCLNESDTNSTPVLQRATYWLAPVVAAVSDDTARHLDEHVLKRRKRAARTFILPNPIDAQSVDARRSRQIEGDRFRFCSLGRLARQKGHDLCRFERLQSQRPAWVIGNA